MEMTISRDTRSIRPMRTFSVTLWEETDIDPENITKAKKSSKILDFDITNGINYKDNAPGSDLDVPGSELDDDQEDVGSEDEENNYYRLGEDDPDEDYDDILFTNKQ